MNQEKHILVKKLKMIEIKNDDGLNKDSFSEIDKQIFDGNFND